MTKSYLQLFMATMSELQNIHFARVNEIFAEVI